MAFLDMEKLLDLAGWSILTTRQSRFSSHARARLHAHSGRSLPEYRSLTRRLTRWCLTSGPVPGNLLLARIDWFTYPLAHIVRTQGSELCNHQEFIYGYRPSFFWR